jgi:predicted nucleotidyltransferase
MLGYLTVKEEQAVKELKQKLSELLGNKLNQFILYGSKARGDFVSGSDIDLLIVVDGLNLTADDQIVETANNIELKYELPISVHTRNTEYYRKEMDNRINLFMLNIKREGIII